MSDIDRPLEVVRSWNAKRVGLQFLVVPRTTAVELAQEIDAVTAQAK